MEKYNKWFSERNHLVKTHSYKKAPFKLYFPNYLNFAYVNESYSAFFQKIMMAADKVYPIRGGRINKFI